MFERSGQFTLRDLFALTAVVGIFCALIPSCLLNERVRGRRTVCLNNMKQVEFGVISYESTRKYYPGYANMVAGRTTSYIIPLLPYIERNDLYTIWNSPTLIPEAASYMFLLVCPQKESLPTTGTPLAYVINAGQADSPFNVTADTLQAGGIAFDLTKTDPIKMSSDYIAEHDGLDNTILLSENLQATSWTNTNNVQLYLGTTFLWWNNPPSSTTDYKINRGKNKNPKLFNDAIYCRPSSTHAGGANFAFCGGNVRFISEDIDYRVYKQLMTPNGADSGDTINRPLSDTDDY